MRDLFAAELRANLRGEVLENEPLAGHTSLKVGGPADWFAIPADRDDLLGLLALATRTETPLLVVGGGYNLLVRDGGFRGLVVSLARLGKVERLTGSRIRVEAGLDNRELVRFCRHEALAGLEFLGMIPGTVGGALAVNAGAHGSSVMELVERLFTWCSGQMREWDGTQRSFGYRYHRLAEGEVIVAAELGLSPGDTRAIDQLLEVYREHRQTSQRVGFPNAGSFFKNPAGTEAWRLIEAAGLRGARIGGAQVSEVHCNFLVNRGGATAGDFLELAGMIKQRVSVGSGIMLEEEVKIVGEDTVI